MFEYIGPDLLFPAGPDLLVPAGPDIFPSRAPDLPFPTGPALLSDWCGDSPSRANCTSIIKINVSMMGNLTSAMWETC